MALFKRTKKEPAEKKTEAVKEMATAPSRVTTPAPKKGGAFHLAALRRPRITEKATENAERGVYVFEIGMRATKQQVIRAIQELYKVTPVKVRTARIPSKTVASRTRRTKGVKGGGKKAYVYLKKGDTIEVV